MAVWRSKLGTSYPRDLIERLDAEHHRTLKRLRQEPGNQRCAECGAAENTWVSVNLGVFLCTRCADVHRAMGTHLSKVKGCGGTYLWGADELAQMEAVGNARAAALYCAKGAPQMARDASKDELLDFCQKKYGLRLWASTDTGGDLQTSAPTPAAVREQPSKTGGRESGTPEVLKTTPPRKPAVVAEKPRATPIGQNINFLDFDDAFDPQHAAPAAPPRLVELPQALSVHDLKDLIDLSEDSDPASAPRADDLTACFDVISPKAVTEQGSETVTRAAPAWQPKGPESDDLWADWGAW